MNSGKNSCEGELNSDKVSLDFGLHPESSRLPLNFLK